MQGPFTRDKVAESVGRTQSAHPPRRVRVPLLLIAVANVVLVGIAMAR
jgi:hypothetical protein